MSFFRNGLAELLWFLFYNRLHFKFLKSKKILKIFVFLILLILVGVILTGERSNGLKADWSLIFVSIIDYVKLRSKILIFRPFL